MNTNDKEPTPTDCKERAALDLMKYILLSTRDLEQPPSKDPNAYFELYSRCLAAVSGKSNPQ